MFFYTFMPKLFNMSLTASVAIVLVVLLRLLLKKAPKVISYALWGVVLFRLLCPVSIGSNFSVYNLFDAPAQESGTITSVIEYVPSNIVHTEYPSVALPVPGISDVINETLPQGQEQLVADPLEAPMSFATYLWMIGVSAMVIYSIVSYIRLRRKLSVVVPLRDNIFIADDIKSPFVVGLFNPKIYLPCNLGDKEQEYIILHEKHHIRRFDHIVKALAFFALVIHWFNPLVWAAFILTSKDMEMSCDEAVIRKIGGDVRADYSASLLTLATGRRIIAGTPLAFGEGDTKGRINNLSKWKKPTVWVVLLAVVACIVFAVCFLTNPISKNPIVLGANYDIEEVLYAVTVGDVISTEPPLQYCITADYYLYYLQEEGEDWNYLGALTPYKLTNGELNSYMPVDEMRKDVKIRQITDSYILKVADDNFYLVFQTKNGKTYLAYGWEDVGERGQAGSDDTRLRRLYLLDSSFHSGYVNVNFFQRSLKNTVGNNVYCFANFESDKIPGYHITGFKAGDSNNHSEMTDLGFAVFQTTGEGYRLIDCKVYENAALVDNGIFFCSDPAVADINGEIRNDNTFDVLIILNEDVDKVERVYHKDGKEDRVEADTYINAPYMSLWSWEYSGAATSVSQYVYDKDGNKLSYDSVIPLNSASWENLPTDTNSTVTKWFDYLVAPDEMNRDGTLDINLPEFPDVNFRWSYGEVAAVKGNKITSLYTGMPIWNTYFCDLTGDGLPELCSSLSWGSGMIDNRVMVYDYANGVSYSLEDCGVSDYTLRQDESDGQLYVDKKAHIGGGLLSTGRLMFEDDCLQVLWPEKPNDNIQEITDPTNDPNFAYDTAVEKIYEDKRNEYFISGLYSQHIIVYYTDGTQEDIVTALNAGRATFADLDRFGIRYWAEPKATQVVPPEDTDEPDALYTSILNAIRGVNRPEKPDGLIHCASFALLKQETLSGTPLVGETEHKEIVIAYGIALHQACGFSGHTFHPVRGSHVPAVITFEVVDGVYSMTDYWTPRDDSYYVSDVRNKFPDDIENEALDTQKYVLTQMQECYDQAVWYGGVDTDYAVEYLFEVIESSPANSTRPSDYINAHLSEYRELTYYGSYTLRYIFSQFLEGNQTGLRGHLMRAVLDDIAPEAQLRLYAETGQEYFDEWKAGAIRVGEQHDMDWIKENQPAIWLLLKMIDE